MLPFEGSDPRATDKPNQAPPQKLTHAPQPEANISMNHRPPRFGRLRCLIFFLILLVSARALGQEETEASDIQCSIILRDPLDTRVSWIEWAYVGDEPLSRLLVRAADRSDVVYWLEGRVHFDGQDVLWSQGPYLIDPLEEVEIDVEIPDEAWISSEQADYASNLAVRLIALDDISEVSMERLSAAPLRLLWPDGATMLLMDTELAELLAPGGVYAYGAAASIPRLEEEGVVLEYGPGG